MTDAMERLKARQPIAGGQSGNVLDFIMQPTATPQGDVVQLSGGRLHSFSGHTFQLRPIDDPYMVSLAESIKANGILEPLLVRPHPTIAGDYEIIAGHTRHHLGAKAGLVSFPCVVRDLSDADAVIQMGESNVQRPDWLPSEKARTYKAHFEAVRSKRYGKVEPGSTFDSAGVKTRDLAAKRWGITGKALELYIKLADLHPGLLQMVDEGRIPVKAGYQLTFLYSGNQEYLYELLLRCTVKVTPAQAAQLRNTSREGMARVLGLEDGDSKPAKTRTWSIALPRELLHEGAKQYLADPELQGQIIQLVNEFIVKHGSAEQDPERGFQQ